jgi:hypothetical protein
MLTVWRKYQQETEFTCVTKRTRHICGTLVVQTLWKIMNERQDYDYDKRNISVVICDTNILNGYPAQVMVTSVKLSKWWPQLNHFTFLCSVLWIIICPLSFGQYMVCVSPNGLWLVLLYPKLFLIASHCIYVCIGRHTMRLYIWEIRFENHVKDNQTYN